MPRRSAAKVVEDIEQAREELRVPVYMPAHEVQKIYLEIMERIGKLERSAPAEQVQPLVDISVKLCRVKRKWIGIVDELKG